MFVYIVILFLIRQHILHYLFDCEEYFLQKKKASYIEFEKMWKWFKPQDDEWFSAKTYKPKLSLLIWSGGLQKHTKNWLRIDIFECIIISSFRILALIANTAFRVQTMRYYGEPAVLVHYMVLIDNYGIDRKGHASLAVLFKIKSE